MPHSEDDLDALSDLLNALPPEDDAMGLSAFDGFCAGLVVSPQVILPDEWLPIVWGDGSGFTAPGTSEHAMSLAIAHYGRVAAALRLPVTEYEAVFETDPHTEETLWEFWFAGFEAAMALRPDCWDDVAASGDDAAMEAVSVFVQLHLVANDEEGLDDDTVAYLTAAAPELIPEMVVDLNAWSKARGGGRLQPDVMYPVEPPVLGPAGRRDARGTRPCPCGSGRAHRRCCGAN